MNIKKNRLILKGDLRVEVAEKILELALDPKKNISVIDLSGVTHLHSSVLQILLALKIPVNLPDDAALNQVFQNS